MIISPPVSGSASDFAARREALVIVAAMHARVLKKGGIERTRQLQLALRHLRDNALPSMREYAAETAQDFWNEIGRPGVGNDFQQRIVSGNACHSTLAGLIRAVGHSQHINEYCAIMEDGFALYEDSLND